MLQFFLAHKGRQGLIQTSGIASAEAFGTGGSLNQNIVQATSISSGEAFGAGGGLVRILTEQTSISSAEVFGAGSALVITTLYIVGSGILSEEKMGGGILSVGLFQDTSIPSEETFGSGSTLYLVNGIYQTAGIPSAEAFGLGGIIRPNLVFLSGAGIQSAEVVGGGSLNFNVRLVESASIPSEEKFGAGSTILTRRDACAGPMLPLPESTSGLSSFDLAQQSGLDQSLFEAFFNQIPSYRLKMNADAVAEALGINADQLKARIAFAERSYAGRAAAPPAAHFKALKKR